MEIEPAEEGFQSGGLSVLITAGGFGDDVNIGVPAPMDNGSLFLREDGQDLVQRQSLSGGPDQLDCLLVEVLFYLQTAAAQPAADQNLLDTVTHMGEAQRTHGMELVGGQLNVKVIFHSGTWLT